jgi:hypothetical protein
LKAQALFECLLAELDLSGIDKIDALKKMGALEKSLP